MKAIFIVTAILSGILIFTSHLLPAWILVFVSLAAFTIVCGQIVTGQRMGALIDSRNVMSLSRFQIVLWTLLILSAYLTAALHNIRLDHNILVASLQEGGPLGINIPKEL